MKRYRTCYWCGLFFLPVDWLPWRRGGYCSETCVEAKADALELLAGGQEARGFREIVQGELAFNEAGALQ